MTRSLSALALALVALPLVACKDSGPPPVAPSGAETGTPPVATVTTPPPPPATSTTTTGGAMPPDTAPTPTPMTAPGGGDFFGCTSDADCVSVPKNECCNNGHREAVNKTRVDAYKASFTCPSPKQICPHYMVNDTRSAVCDAKTKQCVMSDSK